MLETTIAAKQELIVSEMAEHLIGSEIIRIGAEVKEKIRNGHKIYNYTVGDFDPKIFPIPSELNKEIVNAYQQGFTNYPDANGIPELRKEVSTFLHAYGGLNYTPDEILISAGARPLIYGIFATVIDKGDKVIVPLPSWNNNHYCHMFGAEPVYINTGPEDNFMPTADSMRPHIKDATLVALCSPLNPTGTIFSKEQLEQICDLILEENQRRNPDQKPLYLMYDQIYWMLCYNKKHYDPVSLRPEMKPYTVFVDGISKSFAATGVRVGWSFGPQRIIDKMKSILSHVGAWAPKPEQVATAKYLKDRPAVDRYLSSFKKNIDELLVKFYNDFNGLKKDGFRVDCVEPMAAIYLTVQFDLKGMKTRDGKVLSKQSDVTSYLLNEAGLALVPFFAFGSSPESSWYRLSVGTCSKNEIDDLFVTLSKALSRLQ